MKAFTMAVTSMIATIFFVATGLASPHDGRDVPDDDNGGNDHATCVLTCIDQFRSCLSDAQSAHHACLDACGSLRGTARSDCNAACQTDFRSARMACNAAKHVCLEQCRVPATATPTETNTPVPTETNTAAPTETSTAAPTETSTAVPTETSTAVPTETSTAVPTETNTAVPTETNTAVPTETSTAVPTETSTETPTETATPALTATETSAATPTETNTAGPTETATATETETSTPAPTITETPVPTDTPTATATETETPAGVSLTCTFASGTQVVLNNGSVAVTLALTGFQELMFSTSDANGVRTISIPASGGHFDCAALPLNSGVACTRPDPTMDGSGTIDCNGTAGTPGYNVTAEQDHNSNQNNDNPGFDGDTTCIATFAEPDGFVASALLEVSPLPHPGVCNSPIHITESGTFPAGGMVLNQHLILRLNQVVTSCTPNPCPPDNAAFDAAQGDTRFFPVLTTGTGTGTVFDQNNTLGTLTANITGAPQSCANIDANNLSTGSTVGGVPALDLPLLADSISLFTIKCQ